MSAASSRPGGSGGTALVAPGMRALPIGVPKLMVSTVASGQVAQYVGPSDICMMYSVTDVSGINRISRVVLANAAHAIAGMVRDAIAPVERESKPAIGLTMFGVTTPCVQAVTKQLEDEFDCLVFHATGTGGQSMEKLVDSGLIAGALDITTTEVCDDLVGGFFPPGPTGSARSFAPVPYVGSCGALDMVNFGRWIRVPAPFADRQLYEHNAQRHADAHHAEENARIGRLDRETLNRMDGAGALPDPEGGVSGCSMRPENRSMTRKRTRSCSRPSRPNLPRRQQRRKLIRLAHAHQRSANSPRRWRPHSTSHRQRRPARPAMPDRIARQDLLDEVSATWSPAASRSSAAAPAPASRRNARRPAAST